MCAQKLRLLGAIDSGVPGCKLHSFSNAARTTHDSNTDKQLVWLLHVWSFLCFMFPEQRVLCVCGLS